MNADRDPVIAFRVSHAITLQEAAAGVKDLKKWALVAFSSMTVIGGGILATLLMGH